MTDCHGHSSGTEGRLNVTQMPQTDVSLLPSHPWLVISTGGTIQMLWLEFVITSALQILAYRILINVLWSWNCFKWNEKNLFYLFVLMVLIQVRILIFLKAAIYDKRTSPFFFCVTGLSSFQHFASVCQHGWQWQDAQPRMTLNSWSPAATSQVQDPSCGPSHLILCTRLPNASPHS